MPLLRIVTRTSQLAMWQAHFVRDQLIKHHPQLEIEIIGVKTTGDRNQDVALYKIGGKSVFVKELEEALLRNEADIAVHSLKDVPAKFPDEFILAAIMKREDPFDAWVCPKGYTVENLPPKSIVGTSSLRRAVQLKQMRPDLEYLPLRGNVDTRVKKCQSGEFDAIVLACAGLKRIALSSVITQTFTEEQMLPAVGQGALGIECRADDQRTQQLLAPLNDPQTRACVMSERIMNAHLGGSCQVPIAGYAKYIDDNICLTARVGHTQKPLIIQTQRTGIDPVTIGNQVANDLIKQGALQIIKEILEGNEGRT